MGGGLREDVRSTENEGSLRLIKEPVTAGGRREWKADASRVNAMGLTRHELEEEMQASGHRRFRAEQIWKWMYQKGEYDITKMTDISKKDHNSLKGRFRLFPDLTAEDHISEDGTRKWRLGLRDGKSVESVYIPGWILDEEEGKESRRGAVCVSSQVGCTLQCKFCHTGTMNKKILRNLSTSEIIAQIMLVKNSLGDFEQEDVRANNSVTHLVFMGMGEPLYNYRNVKQAVDILVENDGLRLSRRRITLSTAGVVPGILKMAKDNFDVRLAISLHAPNNELRSQLMDINRSFPIEELMDACVAYGSRSAKRITFEYVMLDGLNDSLHHAEALLDLLLSYKIYSFVNLIPFNPWPGSAYQPSSNNRIHAFHKVLDEAETSLVRCAVRWPRGRDIGAACGQLATPSSN